MPLVKVKEKYQVTLPSSIRQKVGLSVGDLLEAEVKGNKITLTPKTVVDRTVEEAIEEGLRDLRAGRVHGPFASVKEFKKYLKNR